MVFLYYICCWFVKCSLQNMTDKIKHLGVVESVDGPYLKVRILQTSACSACSLKGHCSASESKEKVIDVINDKGRECSVGQQVMIGGTTSMGLKAVFWAFCLPFMVLVASLFVCMGLTGDEMFASLVALSMLIPYYIMIYFLRDRFKRTFIFTLE